MDETSFILNEGLIIGGKSLREHHLDISTYAIKRLCTHSLGGDVTAGYIQMDVERLRAPMQKITDYFLKAMGKTAN